MLLIAMAAGLPATGHAYPLKSLYTTIDLKACAKLKAHPDGSAWRCRGLPGYPVYVAEGDLRTFISVGANAEKRRAAEQTLSPFNTIFPAGSRRATLEWRFNRKGDALVPYATILRYYTKTDSRRGEILVVTKVSPVQTCQMAYIDALATPEPIVLAHRIADETARSFDCGKEPVTVGFTGKSPL
ncbi:MAG: hypothetical protein HC869_14815 [Rhodospirillales bacterium]|nr:hypothetical protein [Rhodospirillales bacterium]